MIKEMEDRLREIMKIAHTLNWVLPSRGTDYFLMRLSEVEKCMVAMVDIDYLKLMRKWYEKKLQENRSKDFKKEGGEKMKREKHTEVERGVRKNEQS